MWPEKHTSSVPAAHLELLRGVHEQFLLSFEHRLAEYLELPVAAAPGAVVETSFSDFTEPDSHAGYLSLEVQLPACRVFVGLSSGLISRVLDILVGTNTVVLNSERQGITDIEIHIMQDFFGMLAGGLRQVWTDTGIALGASSVDSVLPNARRLPGEECMIVLESEAKIGDTSEHFRVAVPALLVRFAASLTAVAPERKIDESSRSLESLKRASFRVEAVLTGSKLRLGDLLAIETGQVLMLPLPIDQTFECQINGLSKFQCELIQFGPRQAMEIAAPLQQV